MLTRTFSSLVSKVSASAPGCPQPMLLQYIRDAAVRVCERTLLWRYTPPTFTLLPGVHEYGYERPAHTDVCALLGAIVNDTPLDRLSLDQALRRYPQWADLYSGQDPSTLWGMTPSGTFNTYSFGGGLFNENASFVLPDSIVAAASEPRVVTQLTPDKYIVLPLPDNAKPYTMRMFYALKPSRTAVDMDEGVMNLAEDAIAHGALQHLLVIPNVAWTDRDLATYHAKQFLRELTSLRANANLTLGQASLRVSIPKFV